MVEGRRRSHRMRAAVPHVAPRPRVEACARRASSAAARAVAPRAWQGARATLAAWRQTRRCRRVRCAALSQGS
eukprot:5549121-Pleurochrysis_carterae.AAC.1